MLRFVLLAFFASHALAALVGESCSPTVLCSKSGNSESCCLDDPNEPCDPSQGDTSCPGKCVALNGGTCSMSPIFFTSLHEFLVHLHIRLVSGCEFLVVNLRTGLCVAFFFLEKLVQQEQKADSGFGRLPYSKRVARSSHMA